MKEREFEQAYYFPYFEGSGITTFAEIVVERKIEKEQYVGMCEDSKIGISLIFTLQNGIEYMEGKSGGIYSRPHHVCYIFRTCFIRYDSSAGYKTRTRQQLKNE